MRKLLFSMTGMTLASALVAAGVAGGIAMVIAELMKRISEGQREVASIQDQLEIQKEVALLISKEHHCKASLVWDGDAAAVPPTGDAANLSTDREISSKARCR